MHTRMVDPRTVLGSGRISHLFQVFSAHPYVRLCPLDTVELPDGHANLQKINSNQIETPLDHPGAAIEMKCAGQREGREAASLSPVRAPRLLRL
jgi:hypothetical protein